MKTSVALCTYNGEKYLAEQLDSILKQTTSVDEIVVCDDGSQDGTLEILSSYQKQHPNILRIYKSETNLGSVKNFEKAISLCKNEIIFLADQDDRWLRDKVAVIIDFFKKNPPISVVCSSGYGMDGNGKTLDVFTIWDVPQLLKENGVFTDYYSILSLTGNFATGAAMALRKDFAEKALPFPNIKNFHHDEWLALLAAKDNSFEMLQQPLFYYRQHSRQLVGGVFYPNTEASKKRLTDFYNVSTEITNFKHGKTLLKRIAESHKKKINLLATEEGSKVFQNNLADSELLYKKIRTELLKKFCLRARLQFLFDSFSRKRKIN